VHVHAQQNVHVHAHFTSLGEVHIIFIARQVGRYVGCKYSTPTFNVCRQPTKAMAAAVAIVCLPKYLPPLSHPNNVASFLFPSGDIAFLQNEGLLAPFSIKYVLRQPWNESHFRIRFHGKSGGKIWILARMARTSETAPAQPPFPQCLYLVPRLT